MQLFCSLRTSASPQHSQGHGQKKTQCKHRPLLGVLYILFCSNTINELIIQMNDYKKVTQTRNETKEATTRVPINNYSM